MSTPAIQSKIVRAVAIRELSDYFGWRIEGLNGYRFDVTVPTAVEALELVRLEDRREQIRTQVDAIFTVVTWCPVTGIGRRVVRAVTGAQ